MSQDSRSADAISALKRAQAALDIGAFDAAKSIADDVLERALTDGNRYVEAKALACIAHSERTVSRFRSAHAASQRSAQLFRIVGDVSGESEALTTLAHVASNLGRNEEAFEAALLGVRLSEHLPPSPQRAAAYNYLGVAFLWACDFDRASSAFESAVQVCRSCSPPINAQQPRLNQLWTECVRIFYEGYHAGGRSSLESLTRATERCLEEFQVGHGEAMLAGALVTRQTLFHLGCSLHKCWTGNLDAAIGDLSAGRTWLRRYPTTTWLDVLAMWVNTEIAWAQRNWDQAESNAIRTIEIASSVEHEQLAYLGHLLAIQIYEARGQHSQALSEHRRLRSRQQRVRTEILAGREQVVGWQLELRRRESALRRLQATSRNFERLSHEDPLTGLANRRRFESHLEHHLRGRTVAHKVSLALIDIDRFKQVNDTFSHLVGDRVLKQVAECIRSLVRQGDLPVRLAGDEFVIVFHSASHDAASSVCARIRDGIAAFDWDTIARGLRVTVSVGVAQGKAGDTATSLLYRADQAMYEAKNRRDPHRNPGLGEPPHLRFAAGDRSSGAN